MTIRVIYFTDGTKAYEYGDLSISSSRTETSRQTIEVADDTGTALLKNPSAYDVVNGEVVVL